MDGPAPRGQDLLLPEATGRSWSQCSLAVKSVDTQLVVVAPRPGWSLCPRPPSGGSVHVTISWAPQRLPLAFLRVQKP